MESISQIEANVSEHHWRHQYHISAPAYWINDPNGFSYFKGEFHLFYQHHPYSPEWGPMHWGHVKSKDLATWEHLPIAIAPSEEYDKDGCFSGSAIEKDGKLYLIYTGNVWTGENREEQLKQVQAIAVSENGIQFQKLPENPVITEAPEGDIHPFHFRDPKVWRHENTYYCVLGSRTKEHIGQVLLYKSENLIDWEFMSVMAKGEGNFGYMWECPDFFELDGTGVLVMSPQGMKSEGVKFHNLHQSGYVLGELNYETGLLQHGEFEMLDYGFDFYAPQTTIDDKGRRILIAWMNMWESKMPEQQHNWAGSMTLPRELKIVNGKIYSKPVDELKKLRRSEVVVTDEIFTAEKEFPNVCGQSIELMMTLEPTGQSTVGIKLLMDKSNIQETLLTYNTCTKLLTIDREKSGEGPGGIRQAPVELVNGQLKLHIFIDHSSVEIFVNDGEKVLTARVYPTEQAETVQFFADKECKLIELKKWEIDKGIK